MIMNEFWETENIPKHQENSDDIYVEWSTNQNADSTGLAKQFESIDQKAPLVVKNYAYFID